MPYVASPMLIGDKRNFFGRLSGVVEQDQRYERGVSTEDREIEPITCEGQSERKRLASFGPESYLLNPKVLYQGHSANGCTIRDKSRSKLTHPRVKGLIQVNRVPIRSNVLANCRNGRATSKSLTSGVPLRTSCFAAALGKLRASKSRAAGSDLTGPNPINDLVHLRIDLRSIPDRQARQMS